MTTLTPPEKVSAPQNYWTLDKVVYKHRPEGADPMEFFDVAIGTWCGAPRLAIRWSCVPDRPLGHPSSSGHPTWFIIPELLAPAVASQVRQILEGHLADTQQSLDALSKWLTTATNEAR